MEQYVLIERDGIINVRQDQPVTSLDNFVFLPFVTEAFLTLKRYGIKPIIITSQEPLYKGEMTTTDMEAIHTYMRDIIEQENGYIEDIMVCPSPYADWERCSYPKTGLLQVASAKHGFNLQDTFFLGDRMECLQAGWAAGCHTGMIKSGKPFKTMQALRTSDRQPDFIVRDLLSGILKVINFYSPVE